MLYGRLEKEHQNAEEEDLLGSLELNSLSGKDVEEEEAEQNGKSSDERKLILGQR